MRNQGEAKKRIQEIMGNNTMLTFTIKQYPNDEWVAQCNEINAIITNGKGYDMEYMQNLMEDAILTCAGIPKELTEGLLKKVWSNNPANSIVLPPDTELDENSSLTAFSSHYLITTEYGEPARV